MNDEEYIIDDSNELGDFNRSFDLASLEAPELKLFSVRKTAVEYDESEGVSDNSVASGSCKSSKILYTERHVLQSNGCPGESLVKDLQAKVRTLEQEKSKLASPSSSFRECERIGDELLKVTEERNRLKLLVKANKSHAVQFKTVKNENEALREALKQRHPNTAFALLAQCQPDGVADERVRQLEETLARVDEQWVRRLNALREQHQEIKTMYEKQPKEDLDIRIGAMKDYYSRKLKKREPKLGIHSTPFVVIHREDFATTKTTTIDAWMKLLSKCIPKRAEMGKTLVDFDIGNTGLITRSMFIRCLTDLDFMTIEQIVDIYVSNNEQVDYKTFLSDLASRSGIFTTDLEAENTTLRNHVHSLMSELSYKIDSIESHDLMATLQTVNEQLVEKDIEIERYRIQLNRLTKPSTPNRRKP